MPRSSSNEQDPLTPVEVMLVGHDECQTCPASLACVSGNAKFYYPNAHEVVVHVGSMRAELQEILRHFKGKEDMARCPKVLNHVLLTDKPIPKTYA
jgi:hypothetical protein